jgi:acetyl-CoA acyltransferase
MQPSFASPEYGEPFPQITWSITPGYSSPLTDAASAVLIMSAAKAAELGLTRRARFHSFAVTGSDPLYMLTGVIPATYKVLDRSGLRIDDIDSYEVNEAFAPVPLCWQTDGFRHRPQEAQPQRRGDRARSRPRRLGRAPADHAGRQPQHTGGRYGLQTMCEGGGMANATIIERL